MDRLERLQLLLKSRAFEVALLAKPANMAALFRGAEVSLGFRQEAPGRIAVCVRRETIVLLGSETEVTRVAEAELSWLDGLIVRRFRWDEWDLRASVKAYLESERIRAVCDDLGAFGENIGAALQAMYYPLADWEERRIRALAQDAARIVEAVAKSIRPGATETQI